MVRSVESLASNLAVPVRLPTDQVFNLYPGTGCVSFICVLSYVVFGGEPDILTLTFCRPRIEGGPPLCICLVFWCIVRGISTGIWFTGNWVVIPGGISPTLGWINTRRRKRKNIRQHFFFVIFKVALTFWKCIRLYNRGYAYPPFWFCVEREPVIQL